MLGMTCLNRYTSINTQINRCANRFGASTISGMVTPAFEHTEWLSSFFTSSVAPPPFYAAFSGTDDPGSIDSGTGTYIQLGYLQAEQLRQSLLRAHAAYAMQLMYNGGQGFTASDGSHVDFNNPNVTEFEASTVLKPGAVPAYIPLALFLAWAFIGSTLGMVYGFKRRWSAILDGYSLFRFGADLPDDVRERLTAYTNMGKVEQCHELNNVPGLVGDTRQDEWPGHIGLVRDNAADKSKKYL